MEIAKVLDDANFNSQPESGGKDYHKTAGLAGDACINISSVINKVHWPSDKLDFAAINVSSGVLNSAYKGHNWDNVWAALGLVYAAEDTVAGREQAVDSVDCFDRFPYFKSSKDGTRAVPQLTTSAVADDTGTHVSGRWIIGRYWPWRVERSTGALSLRTIYPWPPEINPRGDPGSLGNYFERWRGAPRGK